MCEPSAGESITHAGLGWADTFWQEPYIPKRNCLMHEIKLAHKTNCIKCIKCTMKCE